MVEIYKNFLQLIPRDVVYWDVFVQQQGEWLCKQTAKSYCKGAWGIFANPLLVNYSDRIHTKQFFNVIFNQ